MHMLMSVSRGSMLDDLLEPFTSLGVDRSIELEDAHGRSEGAAGTFAPQAVNALILAAVEKNKVHPVLAKLDALRSRFSRRRSAGKGSLRSPRWPCTQAL